MPVPTALPRPRCQCLTSLSEPARKLAFEACSWRLWRLLPKRVNTMACRSQRRFRSPGATASRRFLSLQLTALAAASETGKHHGMPVPTALPKPRCQCLTSLSEPARKLAFEACSWRLWRLLPKRVHTMACRSQRRFRSPGATASRRFLSLQLTALAAASETGKYHGMPVPTALPRPRCQCLTSLSEPARKLAFEACSWRLWRLLPKRVNTMACRSQRRFRSPGATASRRFLSLQLTALAAASETGKHHGMPVPTALPKPRCQCLTSLSEPARKLAFEACSWRLWRLLPKRVNTMACRSQRRFRSPGATA